MQATEPFCAGKVALKAKGSNESNDMIEYMYIMLNESKASNPL